MHEYFQQDRYYFTGTIFYMHLRLIEQIAHRKYLLLSIIMGMIIVPIQRFASPPFNTY